MLELSGLSVMTIVFDTETTGLSKDDEVLSIGAVDESGDRIFSSLVGPVRHDEWPYAEKVNHISPAMVAEAPCLEDLLPEIAAACGQEADAYLVVGYNVSFDIRMLLQSSASIASGSSYYSGSDVPSAVHNLFRHNATYAHSGIFGKKPLIILDVMQPAAEKYGGWDSWKQRYRRLHLSEVADLIGYDWGEDSAHDSLSDAKATAAVFNDLYADRMLKLAKPALGLER